MIRSSRALTLPPILTPVAASSPLTPNSKGRAPSTTSPKRSPKKSPNKSSRTPKSQEPRIHVLIKPAAADSASSSLATHSPNNLIFKQSYYAFPSTVLSFSRSTNFELFAKVMPGVLHSAATLAQPSTLILYGSQGSGKVESFFGSGLNDSSFGGFEVDGPPAQYPYSWGMFPRLSLQLLNLFGTMKITGEEQ